MIRSTQHNIESMSLEEAERALAELEGKSDSLPDINSLDLSQSEALLNQLEQSDQKVPLLPEAEKPYSFVGNLPRYAAQTARHVAAGIGDVPDVVHLPNNLWELGHAVLDEHHKPNIKSFGIGENIAHGIDKVTGGYTAPQGKGERMFEAATRAVSGMPLGGGVGTGLVKGANMLGKFGKVLPVKKIGRFLESGTSLTPGNIGATAGSSALMQGAYEGAPENHGKALLAGVIGGLGGRAIPGSVAHTAIGLSKPNAMAGLKNTILKINPEKLKPFRESGTTPLLGDISDSGAVKTAQHAAARHVGAEHPILEVYENRPKEALKNLEINPKETLSPTQLGQEIKRGIAPAIENIKKVSKSLEEKAFEPIRAASGKTKIPVMHTLDDINQAYRHALELEPKARDIFLNSRWWNEAKKIKETGENYKNNGTIPYNSLEVFRKEIGGLGDFDQIPKPEQAQFNRLYGKIKEDLNNYMETQPDHVSKNYKEYKSHWSNWYEEIEPRLNQLLKAGKSGDMTIFNDLYNNLKKGGYKFNIITEGMKPLEKRNFTNSILHNMGVDNDKNYSPNKMFNEFRSMPEEVQKTILGGLTPKGKETFKSMDEAYKNIKETGKYGNFSGTTPMAEINREARELFDGFKKAAHGNIEHSIGKLMSFTLAYGGSKGIIASQPFMDTMASLIATRNKSKIPHLMNKFKDKLGINAQLEKDKKFGHGFIKKTGATTLREFSSSSSKRPPPYVKLPFMDNRSWVSEQE